MKKALALILTLIMVLGLMPAAMAATDDPIQSVTKTENDIVINKSIHPNNDGSYALTIEAYATGTSSTTTQSVPLDIVLVLDVSGSMKETFSNDKEYIPQNIQGYTAWTIISSDTLYYKYQEDYYEVQLSRKDYGLKYVLFFRDKDNKVHYLYGNSVQDNKPDYVSIYETIYTGELYKLTKPSKMYVLKSAVNNFIDTVAADASKNSVNHQIAIVKFAGEKSEIVGNDTYYGENYSQTVVGLTSVSENVNTLKQKVSELTPGGATAADYGMQLANGLLSNPQEGRKQIVVMFTDGEPNHGDGFDSEVANDAISAAKAMKDRKVTVYTIGAIQDPSDNVKNFLDYTSSNYPDAESMGNAGGKEANKYYKLVSTENALAGIFETIASETTQTSAAANASSVLEDKLTGYFNFANFSDGNITGCTVQTATRTGADTWGTPVDASDVSVSVTGNNNDTIEITGFDYTSADNLVVNKDGQWQGNKLIVTFNIVLNESAKGWQAGLNRVDTNASGFACIKDNEGKKIIALSESPQVDVYAYEVKYEVTGDQPGSFTPSIPAAQVYLAGNSVKVAEGLTTTETSKNGQVGVWSFNGWKKGEEAIETIQIPNSPAADGNYIITITGTWTFDPTEQFGSLTIAKDFGGNSAITADNWANATGSKQLTFTIVKENGTPVGTVTLPKDGKWTDTVQLAPGTYTVTESGAEVEGYNLTVTDGNQRTVTVTGGEEFTITFTNTYTPETIITYPVQINKVAVGMPAGTTYPNVTVDIMQGNKVIETITGLVPNGRAEIVQLPAGEYTVEERRETAGVDGYILDVTNAKLTVTAPVVAEMSTAPDAVETVATATITNTYTKMEDDTGSLTVKKTVSGGGASYNKEFTFTVTLTENDDHPNGKVTYGGVTFTDGVATFTLKHNQEKSITGIPEGYTYTVTENADGYTQSITSGSATGTIKNGKTATVTFNNYKSGGDHYYPTPDPVPPIVIPPNTGDMTIWQSILHFLGIR